MNIDDSSTAAGDPARAHTQNPRSDARLCADVAETIARPKRDPADSFILHAPLELLTRTALLRHVPPTAREGVRRRIAALGARYRAAGADAEPVAPRRFADASEAGRWVAAAIEAADLDAADQGATWLADHATGLELALALADDLVPRLGAAGHACIFLDQLLRVAPATSSFARTVRPLVRELAREGQWKLTWQDRRTARVDRSADLVGRLRQPTSPGDSESPFIYPTMSLVERSGLAAELLDDATYALGLREARVVLARIASWSMLQDDPASAPYGWTHCLTMPQATLRVAPLVADPRRAVAVAATYVLGFRATLGRVPIDPDWEPQARPQIDPRGALSGSTDEAVSGVWHASPEALPRLVEEIAANAASHPDAHCAKFTLACLEAASADPASARTHFAAAAYLNAWWRLFPGGESRVARGEAPPIPNPPCASTSTNPKPCSPSTAFRWASVPS